jgi:alcohol dehydrogenase
MSIVGRAAVMMTVGGDLQIREYPVTRPTPGAILVRITCCTICRSDVLSWTGKRPAPTPLILGHEIVGRIVALGADVSHDTRDCRLALGDRISWTIMDSCGRCYFCREAGLPMKCRSLRKYGHDSCADPPHFVGGFAEYCMLGPGTAVFKLPDDLTDDEACPANCALATIVAGWEAAGLRPLENVLIQGAGALGFYAAAFARHAGCSEVIVTDVQDRRLAAVTAFGATATINTRGRTDAEIVAFVRDRTQGRGVDAVLEVAGVPEAVPLGLKCLRIGGRFVEQGNTYPGALVSYDVSDLIFRRLTIRGVHNYDALHLQRGLDFLAQARVTYPFARLVTHHFPLHRVNDALRMAESGEGIRVAVCP